MLRWRLFGISFCIEPSFWFMNALWAMFMAGALTGRAQQDRGLLIFILVWVLCTLVSVMVHELGHVVTGRLFGQPGNITLSGLGGQAVGSYDELRVWQRILVIAMGPSAGFAFFTFIIMMDGTAWNGFMDWLWGVTDNRFFDSCKVRLNWIDHVSATMGSWRRDRYFPYVVAVNILTFINIFVNLMNLFPIIPMDGGMIFKEICCLVFPRQGLKIAFGFSFLLACALTVFYLELTLERFGFMAKRIEQYYPFGFPEFSLLVFASLAYQSYATYRQLVIAERHALYMEDGDRSGPRRVSGGVVEVEPKDPDDFAPPAPGSERPRR